jgi:hypothetical protein
MPFTDNCDLFGSIGEKGINLVGRHVMRQRPSLFNYGTAGIADNRALWCREIDPSQDVLAFSDPLMTVVPPLPIPGSIYSLEYCMQIAEVEIDFHRSNTIAIPAELGSKLPPQHFAGRVEVCAGLGCPSRRIGKYSGGPLTHERDKRREVTLPADELECFCLELFVIGHVETDGVHLQAALDGLEIVDVKPDGLESSLECYLGAMIRLSILPQLRVAVPTMVFGLLDLATVTIAPVSPSTAVPNNPAIEDDSLKVFLDVAVGP